ncbi:peptidase family M1, partial [Teladorsagia circumcincta]
MAMTDIATNDRKTLRRSYNLSVKPYLPMYAGVPTEREMTFDAEVEIGAKTNERVDEIELNMLNLEIIKESCAVTVKNKAIKIRNISVIAVYQKVVFSLEEFIEEHEELKIKISYTGAITEDKFGFYEILYTDKNGLKKTGATTQFEQVHARRMVPCFDEPSFKATWSVTVIHPEGSTALSNGIEVGSDREDMLLYRDDLYKMGDRHNTELIIAHELAHQADYFLPSSLEEALVADDMQSTHPLNWKAEKPDELMEGVSRISYSKGASLLAMIAAIIGADDFYKAVKIGFPLVTVRSVNGSTFEITQERYRKNPSLPDPPKYNTSRRGFKWDVPLWYQINHEPVTLTWLHVKGGSLYISADTANTTIVVNADRYGFYRQNYDVVGWKKIGQQLLKNHTVYSRRTRNAIISDAFAAALVGRIDYKTVLDLIRYLKDETEYIPWSAAFTGFEELRKHIGNAPQVKNFN